MMYIGFREHGRKFILVFQGRSTLYENDTDNDSDDNYNVNLKRVVIFASFNFNAVKCWKSAYVFVQ